jgi:hypothetical protein
MDEFCGDIKHAWGPTAKGYLTHCFDDVVLFGLTVRRFLGSSTQHPRYPSILSSPGHNPSIEDEARKGGTDVPSLSLSLSLFISLPPSISLSLSLPPSLPPSLPLSDADEC